MINLWFSVWNLGGNLIKKSRVTPSSSYISIFSFLNRFIGLSFASQNTPRVIHELYEIEYPFISFVLGAFQSDSPEINNWIG